MKEKSRKRNNNPSYLGSSTAKDVAASEAAPWSWVLGNLVRGVTEKDLTAGSSKVATVIENFIIVPSKCEFNQPKLPSQRDVQYQKMRTFILMAVDLPCSPSHLA